MDDLKGCCQSDETNCRRSGLDEKWNSNGVVNDGYVFQQAAML